jgi:bifunctional UDP-N-acetylglucosamine pyrophosphorylase / glucosamine-1-phosphate N-acetyltransferase
MHSGLLKMLHPVAGRPMIDAVIGAARGVDPAQVVVVTGHLSAALRDHLRDTPDLSFVTQAEQLGTGHAVATALPALDPAIDDVLVLFGDQPLVTPEMATALVAEHWRSGAQTTIAVCVHPDGGAYGRITRDKQDHVVRITEARDIVAEPPGPKEINSAAHCYRRDWLESHVGRLARQSNGEFYLTELVEIAAAEASADGSWPVASVTIDSEAAWGVNDRVQLAVAERIARQRINEHHMRAGVTIVDPAATYIDYGVEIGCDTTIWPGTVLSGHTRIGQSCTIGPGARLRDATIADRCRIVDSSIEESAVGSDSDVGPYAHLRPGVRIGSHVHVGNYAELKNSSVGDHTLIGHVSYLGDATIGEQVNIGAGAITANYDGKVKHPTVIGDGAFIGVETVLRAPVTIGAGAATGGNSFVNRDVPPGETVVGVPARPIVRRACGERDEQSSR